MGRAIEGGGSLRPVAQALMEAVRDRALLESAALRPFRAALGRVLPGFVAEEPIDSIVDPTVVLGEGVLRLLRSLGGSGTFLLLEDLHWADPDTVALLDYLGGALSTSPIIVAATVRDDSPGYGWLGTWPAYRVRSMSGWARSVTPMPTAWSTSRGRTGRSPAPADDRQGGGRPRWSRGAAARHDHVRRKRGGDCSRSFAEVVLARFGLTDHEQRRVLSARRWSVASRTGHSPPCH